MKKYIMRIPRYLKDPGLYMRKAVNAVRYERWQRSEKARGVAYGITCADSNHYVTDLRDREIPRYQYINRDTFSKKEMNLFFEWVNKYYQCGKEEQNIFLDIGANIGTTCIYYASNMDRKCEYIAFEPDPVNYRMLSVNVFLNGLDERIKTENIGLSDKNARLYMDVHPENRGGNRLITDEYKPDGSNVIEVTTTTLDNYVATSQIKPDRIKYIWIDVETHEARVILGGKELFSSYRIPLFMEFTPGCMPEALFEDMLQVLRVQYKSYISIESDSKKIEEGKIEGIRLLWKRRNKQYNIFLH